MMSTDISHQNFRVVLISATLPHEILEMTSKFMTEPVRILVKRDELTLERASNNSLLLLRKRNGSLILCVIFMIH
ncbi:hypothetical protein C2845_PM11G21020 [Panicum miliaceum]|uniref:Uncharacterized protein n=1 Tax=Panicum miliaceum TaxID=4540 RepID=A0A3L6RWD4_PANMI|nr:hypothetical protein C2845_PM11G21020 [Panicum miliaceum]